MGKAFWCGFREGYFKFFWIGIALSVGFLLANYFHPYEQCKRMYNSPEDVMECVWILENN